MRFVYNLACLTWIAFYNYILIVWTIFTSPNNPKCIIICDVIWETRLMAWQQERVLIRCRAFRALSEHSNNFWSHITICKKTLVSLSTQFKKNLNINTCIWKRLILQSTVCYFTGHAFPDDVTFALWKIRTCTTTSNYRSSTEAWFV